MCFIFGKYALQKMAKNGLYEMIATFKLAENALKFILKFNDTLINICLVWVFHFTTSSAKL